jgi:diadenosine tetraphosphate (Ap4A) HIT family hydrolase
VFIQGGDPVLTGSGIIVPRAHRETVFDLSREEFDATFSLLSPIRERLDRELRPHGYNLGWNCGTTAGQELFHCHLHVIPRFDDEPYAGRGIRYWLKQDANRRDASA